MLSFLHLFVLEQNKLCALKAEEGFVVHGEGNSLGNGLVPTGQQTPNSHYLGKARDVSRLYGIN